LRLASILPLAGHFAAPKRRAQPPAEKNGLTRGWFYRLPWSGFIIGSAPALPWERQPMKGLLPKALEFIATKRIVLANRFWLCDNPC
jgi:hypothetical protein